jgi:hypothetical protein
VAASVDLRFSPELVLVFSTPAFVGGGGYPDHFAFVGPAIGGRPDATPFPWDWLAGGGARAGVAGHAQLAQRRSVLRRRRLGARRHGRPRIIVAPRAGAAAAQRAGPAAVPQLALLPHMGAVVCHGSHNTV